MHFCKISLFVCRVRGGDFDTGIYKPTASGGFVLQSTTTGNKGK